MRIPDYLIYDEIKRRRQQEDAYQRSQLELPLYRPDITGYEEPNSEVEDDYESSNRDSSDRGVVIIDMNDLPDIEEG